MEAKFVLARCLLGMALEREARFREAIAEFQAALAISPETTLALRRLAQTYASAGERVGALNLLERLTELSNGRYVPTVYIGAVFAALGEIDEAFVWMNKACDERAHQLVYLDVEPSLD